MDFGNFLFGDAAVNGSVNVNGIDSSQEQFGVEDVG